MQWYPGYTLFHRYCAKPLLNYRIRIIKQRSSKIAVSAGRVSLVDDIHRHVPELDFTDLCSFANDRNVVSMSASIRQLIVDAHSLPERCQFLRYHSA